MCVDELIGREIPSFNNISSDIQWTIDESDKARNLIRNLYKSNLLNNTEFQTNLIDLPDNINEAIKNCYDVRKDEILQAVAKDNFRQAQLPLVENFDWKLKWINGSSKLASLSEPVLQVDLHCMGIDKPKTTVNFEMNLEQLDQFILELESAKKQLSL